MLFSCLSYSGGIHICLLVGISFSVFLINCVCIYIYILYTKIIATHTLFIIELSSSNSSSSSSSSSSWYQGGRCTSLVVETMMVDKCRRVGLKISENVQFSSLRKQLFAFALRFHWFKRINRVAGRRNVNIFVIFQSPTRRHLSTIIVFDRYL